MAVHRPDRHICRRLYETSSEVKGFAKSKILPRRGGLIIIHRHPSLREPAMLVFLFFPRFLFDLRCIPISAPDKKSFYNKWWFKLFRQFCVPVERGNRREEVKVLRQTKELLDDGKIFIIAPGGGREWKGVNFKRIKDGKIEIVTTSSEASFYDLSQEVNGRIIGRFKPGIGWLVQRAEAEVLPVWVETGRMSAKIIIGEPLRFQEDLSREEIVEVLEDDLVRISG